MRVMNVSPEYRKAMEEARMTPIQWARLALKGIPIRAKAWRTTAELNVASVIRQAMSAGRRCRYCHLIYSGKICDKLSIIAVHPEKFQAKMVEASRI